MSVTVTLWLLLEVTSCVYSSTDSAVTLTNIRATLPDADPQQLKTLDARPNTDVIDNSNSEWKSEIPSRVSLQPVEDEEEISLSEMLEDLITRELEECSLVVAVDDSLTSSPVVETIVHLHNTKQLVQVGTQEDLGSIMWEGPGCRGYIFLLQNLTHLLSFANTSPFAWDYSGRYVVLAGTRTQLEELPLTQKGKKTQHIVGIMKSVREGEWLVYVNQLYWGSGLKLSTVWRDHSFSHTINTVFPDKTSDLRGAILKVVTFEWEPSTLYYREKNGTVRYLYGRDVQVVHALSATCNFSIQFVEPPNGERWGQPLGNGSWDGIVGLLGRGGADLAIANLFINTLLDRDQFQGYSTFFDTDESCLLIKTESPLPGWQSPGLPYSRKSWLAFLVGFVLLGPILWLVTWAAQTRSRASEVTCVLEAYSDTLRTHVQQTLSRLPRRTSVRILVGFLLLYTILLRTGYSSNLTAFLTVTRIPRGIDTLKELYESPLVLFEASTFLRDSLAQSPNPYLQGLAKRHVLVRDVRDIIREIAKGRGVFTQNHSAMEFLTNTLLGPSRGAFGARLLKECYSSFKVAVGIPRNSPLKPRLDQVISRIFESGLVSHWKQESYGTYKQNKEMKGEDNSGSDTLAAIVAGNAQRVRGGIVPLSLDHLQTAFYVLAFCSLLSLLTFLAEVAWRRSTV